LPELFFSLKALKSRDYMLALGDVLGTVLADATIVVGILALVSPFYFPVKIIYITGFFMIAASVILVIFMQSDKKICRKEAYALFFFWLVYAVSEFIINK
jgi:Ca2+/Na+ antiporter